MQRLHLGQLPIKMFEEAGKLIECCISQANISVYNNPPSEQTPAKNPGPPTPTQPMHPAPALPVARYRDREYVEAACNDSQKEKL